MPPPELPFHSVSWKVNTRCNYRCTYCLQPSFTDPYPNDIPGTVDLISDRLGRPYEVKIAGGEVVASPKRALALTRALERRGHWLSMCTNFWADVDVYKELVDAMRGRFYHIQVSLHLEYVEARDFLEKCLALREHLPDHAKLVVNNVIPDDVGKIRRLGEIKAMFESEGVVFYTDLLVDTRGRYLDYSAPSRMAIALHLGEESRLFEAKGSPCRAGQSYFVLLPDLDAWKCWDGYLREDRAMYLGNMRTGDFHLDGQLTLCPYDTCSCPTPLIKHGFKLEAEVAGLAGLGPM